MGRKIKRLDCLVRPTCRLLAIPGIWHELKWLLCISQGEYSYVDCEITGCSRRGTMFKGKLRLLMGVLIVFLIVAEIV